MKSIYTYLLIIATVLFTACSDDDNLNTNDVKVSLQTYLESAEANAQEYFGEEVNKIKNALLDSNDKYVVLVIADDMEQAKYIVEKILK